MSGWIALKSGRPSRPPLSKQSGTGVLGPRAQLGSCSPAWSDQGTSCHVKFCRCKEHNEAALQGGAHNTNPAVMYRLGRVDSSIIDGNSVANSCCNGAPVMRIHCCNPSCIPSLAFIRPRGAGTSQVSVVARVAPPNSGLAPKVTPTRSEPPKSPTDANLEATHLRPPQLSKYEASANQSGAHPNLIIRAMSAPRLDKWAPQAAACRRGGPRMRPEPTRTARRPRELRALPSAAGAPTEGADRADADAAESGNVALACAAPNRTSVGARISRSQEGLKTQSGHLPFGNGLGANCIGRSRGVDRGAAVGVALSPEEGPLRNLPQNWR